MVPNALPAVADAGVPGLAKKLGTELLDDGALAGGCEPDGFPNEKVEVEGAGAAAVVLAWSDVLVEGAEGNSEVDALGASAGFGAAEGMLSEGRSDVEALVGGTAVAAGPNVNVVAFGASAGLGALDDSPGLAVAVTGAGAEALAGAGVAVATGFFSGGAESCLTLFLSLDIASASKSCFSHFEYDRDERSLGLSGAAGTGTASVEMRRPRLL